MKCLFLFLIVLLPWTYALEGSVPLLAVQEKGDIYEGSIAELKLEIKEGSGRVFVDTFPLSKIDTQISMRIAKEIACDFLDKECDEYDFIYTIKANSPIIGGPSAGAAATALTIGLLSDTQLRKDIAVTGTINSGGLIGPVGGVAEKTKAAEQGGLALIMIAEGKLNETMNMTGDKIRIKEVADIYDVMEQYTGEEYRKEREITISASYIQTMQELAGILCRRNTRLQETSGLNRTSELYEEAMNLTRQAQAASNAGQFYSAASYCFGSNVRLNQNFLEGKNLTQDMYKALFAKLEKEIDEFADKVEKLEIKTITDLESFMVVKERLAEAQKFLNASENSSAYEYSYATERLYSAYSWRQFHQNKGKILSLDKEKLKESCSRRIAETEERLQYAAIYLPIPLIGVRQELSDAYVDFNGEEYALCLFKASKAKAQVNIVLNAMGTNPEHIAALITNKLNAASRVIDEAEKKGMFPILGYSYYEYAQSLRETDQSSALLYAEYALELSNLDVYFKAEKDSGFSFMPGKREYALFGFVAGIIVSIAVMLLSGKKRKKRK